MRNTDEALGFLIEKHIATAKDFKDKPSGEESRQLAQFLTELLAYRKLYAEWKEKMNEKIAESK